MTYNQYSEFAYTGDSEQYKNRIANNAYDSSIAEGVEFPYAYDVFVNKENTVEGGFTVNESHIPSQLDGSKLYLDHKVSVNATGGWQTITSDDGTIDSSTYNISDGSVEFSSLPSSSVFNVTYQARGDKVWDSHINALQNAVMRLETTVGLRDNDPIQTGLLTLPIATTFTPASQAELTAIRNSSLQNMVLLGHLHSNIKIGSTDVSDLAVHGAPHTITFGNPSGDGKDSFIIDTPSWIVNRESSGGDLIYSASTGDFCYFSGQSEFASQMTVGAPHTVTGTYSGVIPSHMTGFYNNAMLRVNGDIYFGGNMSGNGSITFVLSSGEIVDIIGGNLNSDNITVENSFIDYGTAEFRGHTNVVSPGYFETNSDMVLTDKANNTPATIDGLDPSYAKAAVDSPTTLPGTVGSPIYDQDFTAANSNPYPYSKKWNPLLRYNMYPIIGGWTFTGTVNFDIASDFDNKNVALCESSIKSVYPIGNSSSEGSYCPGLFAGGDTYLEIDNGGSDAFAYPIYYHEAFTGAGAGGEMFATGLNLYIVGDDDILNAGIAGSQYRIFQPSNAPMGYLTSDYSNSAAPYAKFGADSAGYYGTSSQNNIYFKTDPAHAGPSAGPSPGPLYRKIVNGTTLTTDLVEAFQKNIGHEEIIASGGYGISVVADSLPLYAIAYIYASSHNSYGTREENVSLMASPSPYGLCNSNVWGAGRNINPGQWTLIGEAIGKTSNGTTWQEEEIVAYRPNGLYDSCWIPLTRYRDHDTVGDAAVEDMGRSLPFYITTAMAGVWNKYTKEGDFNFFVEHNLGPIKSLRDIKCTVYVGHIKIDYQASFTGEWRSKHQLSTVAGNVWGGFNLPYGESGGHYHGIEGAGGTTWKDSTVGFLREVQNASIAMYDTRFARISIDDNTYLEREEGSTVRVPTYIRVIIERVK